MSQEVDNTGDTNNGYVFNYNKIDNNVNNGLEIQPMEQLQKITEEDINLIKKIEEKYGDIIKKLYPDVVIRFVRGYAHEKEREKQTYIRIDHYLDRHKNYKFDTILDEPFPQEEACLDAWPIYVYGYDKQGHPVLYDEIGSCDITKVEKAFENNIEKLRQFRFRFMQRLANCKRIQSDKYNVLIYKHVMVMDCSGFSMAHFGQQYRNLVKEVIGDEQHLFPETLYKLFIINAPLPFRMIWKILSTFIDPITVQKISVLGSSFLDELKQVVPLDQIPKKYGGTGKLEIKNGYVANLSDDHYPLRTPEEIMKQKNKNNNNNDSDAKQNDINDDNNNNNSGNNNTNNNNPNNSNDATNTNNVNDANNTNNTNNDNTNSG